MATRIRPFFPTGALPSAYSVCSQVKWAGWPAAACASGNFSFNTGQGAGTPKLASATPFPNGDGKSALQSGLVRCEILQLPDENP